MSAMNTKTKPAKPKIGVKVATVICNWQWLTSVEVKRSKVKVTRSRQAQIQNGL